MIRIKNFGGDLVTLSSKAYLYEHRFVQQVALFGIVMEQEEGAYRKKWTGVGRGELQAL